MEGARKAVSDALYDCDYKGYSGWSLIKNVIKDALKDYVWQETKRSPMILPIIMEV